MLGQSKLTLQGPQRRLITSMAATLTRPDHLFPVGYVALDDLIQTEELPEPESQPDVAESAAVSPADRTQSDAHHIGAIGNGDLIIVGKEAKLLRIALAVVDDYGPLPAALLVMVQFAEIGNDVLTRSSLSAKAFDQGVVAMGLAVLVAGVAAKEHAGLLGTRMIAGQHGIKV